MLHADDLFVRSLFAARERVQVPEVYRFPLPEGMRALVRVRARWDHGNRQLDNAGMNHAPGMARTSRREQAGQLLALWRMPWSLCVYVAVALMARAWSRLAPPRGIADWARR
jgi:hypothetical protein